MKRLISLKQLLFMVLILPAGILNQGCKKDYMQAQTRSTHQQIEQSSTQPIASALTIERTYLDLTKGQIIAGGVTNSMLQNYLKQGYTLQSLAEDKFAKHVGFKGNNGKVYYKDGWLKKGTEYVSRKKFEPYILMACGNQEMDFWPQVD